MLRAVLVLTLLGVCGLAVWSSLPLRLPLDQFDVAPGEAALAFRARVQDLGDRATPELIRGLGHPSPRVRIACLHQLEKLADNRAVETVVERLRDPDGTVRVMAARCLRRTTGWRADRPLLEALTEAGQSDSVRALLLEALLQRRSRAAWGPALEILADPATGPESRCSAVLLLGQQRVPQALPFLQALAVDPSQPEPTRKWSACYVSWLGNVALGCRLAADAGLPERVRRGAVYGLRAAVEGPHLGEARGCLQRVMADERAPDSVRIEALHSLTYLGGPGPHEFLKAILLHGRDPEVRMRALYMVPRLDDRDAYYEVLEEAIETEKDARFKEELRATLERFNAGDL